MLGLGRGTSGEANREPVMWLQTEFDEVNPMISPDGQWVAYVSNESDRSEVYVRPFDDPEAGKLQVSRAGATTPCGRPTTSGCTTVLTVWAR